MGVWLKHKLSILASFGPYISIFSGRGSQNLGGVAQKSECGHSKMGVVRIFRARFLILYIHYVRPGLSSRKLGNYGVDTIFSNCPCFVAAGTKSPSFVGENYYCESENPDEAWYNQRVQAMEVVIHSGMVSSVKVPAAVVPTLSHGSVYSCPTT